MLEHGELCKALNVRGARQIVDRPDKVSSVASKGSGGIGRYWCYRHAIAQDVLDRHFIRSAEPFDFWLTTRRDSGQLRCSRRPPRNDPAPLSEKARLALQKDSVDMIEVSLSAAGLR